jgi:hypothetical protein
MLGPSLVSPPRSVGGDRRIVPGGGGSVLPNDLQLEGIWARHEHI